MIDAAGPHGSGVTPGRELFSVLFGIKFSKNVRNYLVNLKLLSHLDHPEMFYNKRVLWCRTEQQCWDRLDQVFSTRFHPNHGAVHLQWEHNRHSNRNKRPRSVLPSNRRPKIACQNGHYCVMSSPFLLFFHSWIYKRHGFSVWCPTLGSVSTCPAVSETIPPPRC